VAEVKGTVRIRPCDSDEDFFAHENPRRHKRVPFKSIVRGYDFHEKQMNSCTELITLL
jgi:hypothetical protein